MSESKSLEPPYLIYDLNGAGLWIMPAPTFFGSLPNTLSYCANLGMSHVVSLIEPHEERALNLETLQKESLSNGIHVSRLPIEDRHPPGQMTDFKDLSNLIVQKLQTGKGVGVHCKSGIGRSGMLAIVVLGRLGFGLQEALSILVKHRGMNAPNTDRQLAWLKENWAALSS